MELVSTIILILVLVILCFILLKIHSILKAYITLEENITSQKIRKIANDEDSDYLIDKTKSLGLNERLLKSYKEKIKEVLVGEKIFLDSNLRLEDLSKIINLSKHQTSLIVNQCFQKDFNSLINEYRIKEAIKLFRSRRNNSIADVLYQVGFNNSATFNKAFKKTTGITPSQYLKTLKPSMSATNFN